jgi:DNA-directed RNA polymerase subunit RPC12/RpoP
MTRPPFVVLGKTFDSTNISPLRLILAVDGSLQVLSSDCPPIREIAFVKTALVRMDPRAIAKLDPDYPHPLQLKSLMNRAALRHSTVFPLKNVNIPGLSNYDAVRGIVADSLKDPQLEGQVYLTLKWLAYEKWLGNKSQRSPNFYCPHCDKEIQGLPYDADEAPCEHCGKRVILSDMIGFHLEMTEDSAPDSVAKGYMLVHETLLMFSFIRHYWEQGWRKDLSDALFIKDGPLTLRGQYSKLVPPIRRFLSYAKKNNCPIHIIGQEKTGVLLDCLNCFAKFIKPARNGELPSYAVLPHKIVQEDIRRTPDPKNPYGKRTNYGEKVFVKLNPHHHMVISIPVGLYVEDENFPANKEDLIGFDRIMATLPSLVSYRHEGALVPVELANGVASLSNYPSAAVLKIFSKIN